MRRGVILYREQLLDHKKKKKKENLVTRGESLNGAEVRHTSGNKHFGSI